MMERTVGWRAPDTAAWSTCHRARATRHDVRVRPGVLNLEDSGMPRWLSSGRVSPIDSEPRLRRQHPAHLRRCHNATDRASYWLMTTHR